MAKKYKVKCRYGIEYEISFLSQYEKGACVRTVNMLNQCCCFVCHNHSCKEPRDEKIDCHDECKYYWKSKPCEKIINKL